VTDSLAEDRGKAAVGAQTALQRQKLL